MKRRMVLIVLLVLLAAGFAAAQKTSLVLWHSYSGSRAELFNTLVKEWNKANPSINLKAEYGGSLWSMRDKLLTALAGGAGPNLAEIDSYWTPIFAKPGSLVNLEPYIAQDKGFNKPDLARASLQSTQYQGNCYSVPFNLSTIVLYYNKALFKAAGLDNTKAPADWTELVSSAQKLTVDKNGDGTPDQRGITFPNSANTGAVWYWLAFFFQQDGKLFNDSLNSGTFNSEAGVAATNLWRQLAREKLMSLSPGSADFEAENAAMELSSSSVLGRYRDNMGNARFGLSALPKGKVAATVTGGGNMAMFSNCPDKKAGWTVLSWLNSTQINKRWALSTGSIPVRQSVIDTPEYGDYLLSDPKGNIMMSTLKDAFIRPNVPEYGDASRIIAMAVEEAVFKDLDPKPLLDKAKADVDALFKK
jgi:ABC-type glycerol-3-phosphate transport system substrate-binding protein